MPMPGLGVAAALRGRYRGVALLCVIVALNSFGMGAIAPVLTGLSHMDFGELGQYSGEKPSS